MPKMGDYSLRVETNRDSEAPTTILLAGTITAENIGELLIQLTSIFDRTDDVVIDLSGVREIDISGLKFFCSCHRSLLFSGKELRITGHHHSAIRKTIVSEGCQRTSGCAIDSKHSCIWSDGA